MREFLKRKKRFEKVFQNILAHAASGITDLNNDARAGIRAFIYTPS